ncbi:MAG: hypothetical protein K2K92_00190 [Duncaniella sp.]|nr:hypothetical protein [Duncaniella sp.]
MNLSKILILAAAMTCAVTSWSQDLHKDITVEQAITPTRRDAARMSVLPGISLPAVPRATLSYSSRVVPTNVPDAITTLAPVAWDENGGNVPMRGYFVAGIGGPLAAGDVSAGYRILDTDRTRLSLWGQYDGEVYRRRGPTWHDHSATVQADLHQKAGTVSDIDAHVAYTYGFHDMPGMSSRRFSQSASRIDGDVAFSSSTQGLSYTAGVRGGYFSYGSQHTTAGDVPDYLPAAKQAQAGLDLTGRLEYSPVSYWGLDINADVVRTGTHLTTDALWSSLDNNAVTVDPSVTSALVRLTPYYEYSADNVSLRLGAEIDFAKNNGKAIHAAPEVTLSWHGMQIVGVEVKAHGGSRLNTLASLYDITPYTNGCIAYKASHVPQAYDARIALGPAFGASLELFGGWAKANDWLMPVMGHVGPASGMWEALDVKGYHYGVRLAYDNGKTFGLSASYEGAPSGQKNAYYEWRDRARHVVKADLKVRPTSTLTLTASYELRAGRCEYTYSDISLDLLGMTYHPAERISLGTVSDLTVGAAYACSRRLTVFARGENLLSRQNMYIGGRPMPGAHGLAGISIKF